jgi:hypothetical protein
MKNIKIEIKWAFLFIGMSLIWMCLEKFSGLHSTYLDYQMYLTNLFMIPAIWFFVLALKDKKKNFYNGLISYKQGVISGTILTLIIAAFNPLTQYITSYIITPEYFPNVIKRSVEIGYFQTTAEAEAQFNYKNYAIQGTIGAVIMGILTTLIVMLFLRSKKRTN